MARPTWYTPSVYIADTMRDSIFIMSIVGGIIVLAFIIVGILFCIHRRYQTYHRIDQEPTGPAPAHGLERWEIEMFQISPCAPPAEESSTDDALCAICLDQYEAGQLRRILTCAHSYHVECIDEWLCSHRTCPKCRQRY